MLTTDCTDSECKTCVGKPSVSEKGRCAADCGQKCSSDSQCLNTKYCKYCTGGVCSEHQQKKCGETCALDDDCTDTCKLCRSIKCVSTCAQACTKDTDCLAPCGHCVKGACSSNKTVAEY